MIQILLVLLAASAPAEAERAAYAATTLDGQQFAGQLVQMSDEGVKLESAEAGVVELASERLLELRRQDPSTGDGARMDPSIDASVGAADSTPANDDANVADIDVDTESIFIELVDGTHLTAGGVTISDRVAAVEADFQSRIVEIATDDVRLIRFVAPTPTTEAVWQDVASKQLVGDVLLIKKRDGESIDYLSGVVGDVDGEKIVFQWDGDKIPVNREKVAGIVFYHASQPDLPKPTCTVALRGDHRIRCTGAVLDGDVMTLTTPTGLELYAPLGNVQSIDFSAGKLAFLSSMEPIVERWTPLLELPEAADLIADFGAPRRNASFVGSALSLRWPGESDGAWDVRTYPRGLAIRSRTELEYRLDPEMSRFSAIAGIDPDCADQGVVSLELLADNHLLWRGVVDGREPPIEIDVALPTARRLRIVVDYGDSLDFGDRLHLVNAKVTK